MGLRVQPTTVLDKAALIHDIEYLKGDQWKADNNMWSNLIRDNPLNLPLANMTRLAFLTKDIIGYDGGEDRQSYQQLREIVERDYNLGKMKFYD